MKYFFDTEFLEGPQRQRKSFLEAFMATKVFTQPTIDLISIGIVSEDGREYYAISKDFNINEAWNRFETDSIGIYHWIRDHVLKPIYLELYKIETDNKIQAQEYYKYPNLTFCLKDLKYLIKKYGKSNKEIAKEIIEFVNSEPFNNELSMTNHERNNIIRGYLQPEFYAYYASYDWVAFCWLFDRMIDLPKGFPMFPIDLKVLLDIKVHKLGDFVKGWDGFSFEEKLKEVKKSVLYPKQYNEHNALDDAKWNKKLYDFILKLN